MAVKKNVAKTAAPSLSSQEQAQMVERVLQDYGPSTVAQIVSRTGLSAKRVQRHLDYCENALDAQKNGTIPKLKAIRVKHTKTGIYSLNGAGRGQDGAGAFRTDDWQKLADKNSTSLLKQLKAAGSAVVTTAKRVASAKKKAKK